MRTWLLLTVDEEERLYQGHLGYEDNLRSAYLYDSFVPNHGRVTRGDVVIIRDKRRVLGTAVIEHIESREGTKVMRRCPSCRLTRIKERKRKRRSSLFSIHPNPMVFGDEPEQTACDPGARHQSRSGTPEGDCVCHRARR